MPSSSGLFVQKRPLRIWDVSQEYNHRISLPKVPSTKGMCADLCVHDKGDGNPHAHIMLTMRPFSEDGSWAAKSRKEYILDDYGEKIRLKSSEYKIRKINTVDWNDQGNAETWRAALAEHLNAYLERGNHAARVDHRSYERQGIDKIPTVHLGVTASQMEKRGALSY